MIDPTSTDAPGIAVIGMSGRFPGAADVAELWDNLCRGVESIARFSAADLHAAGVDPALAADPRHVAAAGVLADADLFDAPLFQATPREAELLDPQQRVFLECAWAALEDAGYDPARHGHGIGVFAGASLSNYLLWNLLPAGEIQAAGTQAVLGNDKDFLATRVSYKLGLTGPSIDVQTACSTSLVAVILACQSLLNYQCDVALAGGVAVREPQRAGYVFQEGGILSPDGHCRPFDAAARGTVPGNGVGVVVLKRLEDALADGDAIRAVVRGAALNNDGSAKAGFTAPSVTGQAEVVAMALAIAGTPPEEVGFIEAHGTATPLGDPIEFRALARAFRGTTAPERSCALGSLKGNLGHLDAAAGVTGFIKAVLALERRAIPPTLHFERPNPEIDFTGTPFYVNTELTAWESAGAPRRAGVSSFGIGGTNAHVVLEEAPPRGRSEAGAGEDGGRAELLVLSARTPQALEAVAARLAAHLATNADLPLADVARTLRLGRRQLGWRRTIVAGDLPAAAAALASLASTASEVPADPPEVAFLLPGQGGAAAMAAAAGELYRAEEVFRDELDACCRALAPHLGFDLRQVLAAPAGGAAAARERLADTAVAQPALFVVELAMARLWETWGVKPAALLGHSLGELAAACLAGVLPRDEALALVAERGRLMAGMAEGAMLAVPLGEAELLPLLDGELSLAAVNAADRTVASGPPAAIARLAERLAARGVRARPLDVRRAFHSAAVEPIAGEWTAALRRVRLAAPAVPYLSSLTGAWTTAEEARNVESWRLQMRRPVRFAAGVAELLAEPRRVLVEVGPGAGLAALARRAAASGPARTIVSSLPDGEPRAGCAEGSARAHLLAALGRLWTAGVAIDWDAVDPGRGRRVPLPTYPFERRRYWIAGRPAGEETGAATAEPREAPSAGAIWVPLWRQSLAAQAVSSTSAPSDAAWLVLSDGGELGAQLLARLAAERRLGGAPIAAVPGHAFGRVSERAFLFDPASDADLDALLAAVDASAAAGGREKPLHVVHLGHVATGEAGGRTLARLASALGRRGGPSTLNLVTAGAVEPAGPPPAAERAALACWCRAVAAAIPCRWIDLPIAAEPPSLRQTRRLVERLAAELLAPWRPGAVALREGRRWVESWDRVAAAGAEPILRPHRGYLVAGDLGSQLAGSLLAALAALPARVVRLGALDREPAAAPATPRIETAWLANRAAELSADLAPDSAAAARDEAGRALEALCGRCVLAAIAAAAGEPLAGRSIAEADLRRLIALAPRRARLFERLLAILEEDQAFAREDGILRFRLTAPEGSADGLRREIETRSPALAPALRLLDRAAAALPQVLSGELDGLAVLYPEGSNSLFTEVPGDAAGDSGGARYLDEGARYPAGAADLPSALLVEALARAAAARESGRPFRVLEVGAGQGLLTRHLLPALEAAAGGGLEYTFTDIGRAFVLAAERAAAAAGRRSCRFALFDASRDPLDQGFATGAYDAIVAANVIHATPRIVETLGHLRTLLAPGGVVGLVETVHQQRWNDLVWGLTDGWWSFADAELRTRSPLLDPPAWRSACAAAGLADAAVLPEGRAALAAGALVLAHRSAETDDLFVAADLAADPPQALAAAVAAARGRLGTAGGIDGAFFVAAPSGGAENLGAALPGALAGARALAAALAAKAVPGASPRFLALAAEPGIASALAAAGDGRSTADRPLVTIALGGDVTDLSQLDAGLAAGLHGGAAEVALLPPPVLAVPAFQMEPAGDATASPAGDALAAIDPAIDPAALGFHDRPRLLNPFVAPRDETELAVAAIWRRALGIDRLGVDDNFLELGGDSLTGLQVAHAIQERWTLAGRSFSLYEAPTIAAIARFLDDAMAAARGEAIADSVDAEPGASRGERRRARRAPARRSEA